MADIQEQIYQFIVNGVDVTGYVLESTKITLTRKQSEPNKTHLEMLEEVEQIVSINNGDSIIVYRGDVVPTETIYFKGKIRTIDDPDNRLTIDCYDNLYDYKLLLFTKSFDLNNDPEAGEVSAIAKKIIEDGGLIAEVTDTGTTSSDLLLNKFISKRQSRINRLRVLANIVNYLLYEDYDTDKVVFEPEGSETYSTTLEVGVNVWNVPKWRDEIKSMRNRIYVDGAYYIDTRIEEFDGTGTTTTFQLKNTPESVEVYVDGVLQKLGIAGATETYDYTLDKDLMQLTFIAGSIPSAGTDNVSVTIQVKEPHTSYGTSESSFELYGLWQDGSYTFNDIETVEDSDNRLLAILEKLRLAKVTTMLRTDSRGIKPGMLVPVVDSNKPKHNGTYTVQRVETEWPNPTDKIYIGDTDFNMNDFIQGVNDRLNSLEGESDLLNEILRQLFQIEFSAQLEPYYFDTFKFDITTTDHLYWDSELQGTWDDFDWGDDADDYGDLTTRVQGDNTYREYIDSIDFKDASSTGDWNTTTKTITLDSTEYVLTQKLWLGVGFGNCTLNFGNISTTTDVLIELSQDNGSAWETITSGSNVLTTIGTTGILLKITNNSSGVVTIQPSYDATNGYTAPGISLFMSDPTV